MTLHRYRNCATAAAAVIALAAIVFAAEQSVGAVSAPGVQAASAAKRSVIDGVYTVEQAKRGREQYRKRCILCHLDNGEGQQAVPEIAGQSLEREGDKEAPPIAGQAFLKKWNGHTARELFEKTSTMPVGGANSLTPQQYADLVALIFEMNKFPAGPQELAPAGDQLEPITIGR